MVEDLRESKKELLLINRAGRELWLDFMSGEKNTD